MGVSSKNVVSSWVSKLSMKVSVSVSNFGSAWYQYQYRNFRPAEYQYCIGFVDQESISIVSVSEKVVIEGLWLEGPRTLLRATDANPSLFVCWKLDWKSAPMVIPVRFSLQLTSVTLVYLWSATVGWCTGRLSSSITSTPPTNSPSPPPTWSRTCWRTSRRRPTDTSLTSRTATSSF